MQTAGIEAAPAGGVPVEARRSVGLLKAWAPLLVLQALVAGLVLFPFIRGSIYFAFLDIGSDTYASTAITMHLARLFATEGFSGWSFGIGLGAPLVTAYSDVLGQLAAVLGPDHVLELRIWVYLLKLALGGAFGFLFLQGFVQRKETALLAALAYSFCGYIVTNGVWDTESSIYVYGPLVLWAIQRHLRSGDVVALPLAVAAMLLGGVFFVMAGASVLVAFGVCVAASTQPRRMLRAWLVGVLPLVALGFLLAAPYIVPMAMQMLDSPRIGGSASILGRIASEGFAISNAFLLLAQLGGFFHKDIFGVGGMHVSYMNYLESPGFYASMMMLVAMAQPWREGGADRRMLVVGLVAIALYILFPVFRLAAFGFSAPYFRGTTMWVTLGVLLLGARGLDKVLTRGVDLRLLMAACACVAAALALLAWLAPASPSHVWKMAAFAAAWTLALAFASRIGPARLPSVLLGLLLVELVTVAWPSYFLMRTHVSPQAQPFDDMSIPALAAVRADHPPAFYRVEKTFDSFGLSDSLAQDYRGVKSYYYHGRSVVQFHEGMDLMLDFPTKPGNYTNWLPAPGDRFVLHSALGVRYIISNERLDWPGFEPIASGKEYFVYRNELALPLGVVHTRQVGAAEMARLSSLPLGKARGLKDLAIINAAVVEQPLPGLAPFDLAALAATGEVNTPLHYAQPALALQRTGLKVTHFSNERISGTIDPDRAGLLVFSIPASAGWTLRIDGEPVATMTANFGMLAAPVAAGRHQVELAYRLPGVTLGLIGGGVAALVLVLLAVRARRSRRPAGAGVYG
jgi:hypothetical protein